MTEQEWLECVDPIPMLHDRLESAVSRKTLLFSHECFQRHWAILPAACREWAMVAVAVAEGRLVAENLIALEDGAEESLIQEFEQSSYANQSILSALLDIIRVAWEYREEIENGDNVIWMNERRVQAHLLRDIFGNPFRPVTIDPAWLSWRDSTIPKIAQTIYEDRSFEQFPVLADALEEAGCTNADILAHCRGPEPHVRGCWVLDLLLNKE